MSRTLGAEMLAIYHSFPLGVMRADFFRYAMLLDQGGIYADVDTACKVGGSHDWVCLWPADGLVLDCMSEAHP